jgi:ABC-2 type transport system ATP-binding protein
MESTFAIETHGLTKRYGKKLAVNGLDLAVPTGSVFAFLGRNGAGKTTTIRMFLNLLGRTSGDIRVLGLDPAKCDQEIKRRTGYVEEGQHMYGWMKIDEIIRFCADFYPTWDSAYAEELLKALELSPGEKIKNLSRGTQAKVALLLALAHRPELLILDEPTAGLDVIVRREFIEGIIDLIQEQGRTVFFSSHLVHEVERIANWVGIVDCGRMVECMPIEELKARVKRVKLTFENDAPESVQVGGQLTYKKQARQASLTIKDYSEKTLAEIDSLGARSFNVLDLSLEDIFVAYVGERA